MVDTNVVPVNVEKEPYIVIHVSVISTEQCPSIAGARSIENYFLWEQEKAVQK